MDLQLADSQTVATNPQTFSNQRKRPLTAFLADFRRFDPYRAHHPTPTTTKVYTRKETSFQIEELQTATLLLPVLERTF